MKEMLDNLNKVLQAEKLATNVYEYYDYIKIETNCLIDYCDEYLVLYLKPVDGKVFISDLKGVYEDAVLNGIDAESLKKTVIQNGLCFEDKMIFDVTTLDNVCESIKRFFSLMKSLDL